MGKGMENNRKVKKKEEDIYRFQYFLNAIE